MILTSSTSFSLEYLLHDAKNALAQIENFIAETEQILKILPEGNIHIHGSHGKIQYSFREKGKSSAERYIPKSDKGKISDLVNRKYHEKTLAKLIAQRDALRKFLAVSNKNRLDGLTFPPEALELVAPIITPGDEFVRQFMAEPDPPPYKPEGLVVATSANIFVRSKSEMSSVDTYVKYGVPFKYERPITIGGVTYHPDFTIPNKWTGQLIIHEHFGLMSNPEYASNAIAKIAAYQSAGFILGKTLIVSFETESCPFTLVSAEKIFEDYIRPQLFPFD